MVNVKIKSDHIINVSKKNPLGFKSDLIYVKISSIIKYKSEKLPVFHKVLLTWPLN